MDLAHLARIGLPVASSPAVTLSFPGDGMNSAVAPAGGGADADEIPHTGLYAGCRLGSSKQFGFLQEWIDADLTDGGRCAKRRGLRGDVIRTRFPPEPNGYLHIGHAKAITVDFGLAQLYGGRCHLRFDDTNPAAEETEFVESIIEDVKWLGFDWGKHLYYASDYFDQLYEWAEHLISQGKAFVDSETQEEMRAKRPQGVESKFRNRSVEENMKLFREMRDGKHKEGTHVLRMKGDMKNPNMNMRDMPIYRILHRSHHRTGDKWCIYPLYDFAHGQEDAIEGITHSICTLEFEVHRELYNWFTKNLPIKERPLQLEMSRLNVTTFLTSKRKLKVLVEQKVVDGWDDPRMSTLSGMRRRGVTPEALKTFVLKAGVSRSIGITDVTLLESCIRDDLDPRVPRRMVVLYPLRVVIEDYPEGKVETVVAANHPENPELGSRELKFSREVWIEREDFREDAPDSYFRLKPGGEVKLRYSYVIKVKDVVKDATGQVVELRCTHDPATRDVLPSDRKIKGVIHWVSAKHAVEHTVRLYDHLIKPGTKAAEQQAAEEEQEAEIDELLEEQTKPDVLDPKMKDFLSQINPESLVELSDAKCEESLSTAKPLDRFQFERSAFFVVDKYSPVGGRLIFNRTVGLKESGLKKDESKEAAGRSRKDEQDRQKAEKERRKKVNPKDMFRDEGLYSKFDDDGVPTHDQAGEPLSKSLTKKLRKEWEAQKKLFES